LRQLRISFLVCLAVAAATGSDVVDLSSMKDVLKSDELWLVEFYAPWCGHCKQLAPEWAKAATALKGIVKLGAVDMDQHKDAGAPYGITGFPTIKIFGADKAKPTAYNGARTAAGIVDAALDEVKNLAKGRLNGKTAGSKPGGDSKSSGGSGSGSGSGKDDVVELTSNNFDDLVMGSKDLWLVEFFAPWCGHCKTLAPQWAKASTELKGEAKLGAVDATVHADLGQRFAVQGYPTIKYFPAGSKNPEGEAYEGGRTANDIVAFVKDKLSENAAPPEVLELLEQANFDGCTGKQLCFISFLAPVQESSAAGRNAAIATLQAAAHNFRKRPFGWLWTSAGVHEALEKTLDVGGFGYPAMIAVNLKKKKFAVMRTAFADKSITDFVGGLLGGKQPLNTMSTVPKISTVPAWDGLDVAEEVFEEEIDLSSLDDDTEGKTEL